MGIRVLKAAREKLSNDCIVMNVSSEAGSIDQAGRSGEYGYCMSKSALNMASKLFANEVKDTDIRVFCYHPGWLRTQMGGEGAAKSEFSISAEEAAICVMKVTDKGEIQNGNIQYLDYKGNELPW